MYPKMQARHQPGIYTQNTDDNYYLANDISAKNSFSNTQNILSSGTSAGASLNEAPELQTIGPQFSGDLFLEF